MFSSHVRYPFIILRAVTIIINIFSTFTNTICGIKLQSWWTGESPALQNSFNSYNCQMFFEYLISLTVEVGSAGRIGIRKKSITGTSKVILVWKTSNNGLWLWNERSSSSGITVVTHILPISTDIVSGIKLQRWGTCKSPWLVNVIRFWYKDDQNNYLWSLTIEICFASRIGIREKSISRTSKFFLIRKTCYYGFRHRNVSEQRMIVDCHWHIVIWIVDREGHSHQTGDDCQDFHHPEK